MYTDLTCSYEWPQVKESSALTHFRGCTAHLVTAGQDREVDFRWATAQRPEQGAPGEDSSGCPWAWLLRRNRRRGMQRKGMLWPPVPTNPSLAHSLVSFSTDYRRGCQGMTWWGQAQNLQWEMFWCSYFSLKVNSYLQSSLFYFSPPTKAAYSGENLTMACFFSIISALAKPMRLESVLQAACSFYPSIHPSTQFSFCHKICLWTLAQTSIRLCFDSHSCFRVAQVSSTA